SDVTDDMGLGLEYHVAALDRSFYSTVYNDLLCRDASMDLSIWRNDQRSAAHITFYLTVDLNQSFRADATHNLQTAADDRTTTPEHDSLPGSPPIQHRRKFSLQSQHRACRHDRTHKRDSVRLSR